MGGGRLGRVWLCWMGRLRWVRLGWILLGLGWVRLWGLRRLSRLGWVGLWGVLRCLRRLGWILLGRVLLRWVLLGWVLLVWRVVLCWLRIAGIGLLGRIGGGIRSGFGLILRRSSVHDGGTGGLGE